MSAYFLSEAFQTVYKQSLTEDFNDNLRFVDYMLEEDIEAVVESLFWELQDYGCTAEEAFEALTEAASSDVIMESYEIISEGRNPEVRAIARQKKQEARAAQRQQRAAELRSDKRASRVQGGIRRLKAAWSGAKAGFGMANRAMSSVAGNVNQARKEGQAKLTSLLRTGADRIRKIGSDLSGETRRQRELRSDVRKNIRNVRAANRAAELDKFNRQVAAELRAPGPNISRTPDTIDTATPSFTRRTRSQGRVRTGSTRVGAGPNISRRPSAPSSSERRYPSEPSGQTTLFTSPLKGKSAGVDVKVPPSGMKPYGKRKSAKPLERTRQTTLLNRFREEVDQELLIQYIAEDIVNSGYANNVEDALYIIENLSENVLYEITQEYLAE